MSGNSKARESSLWTWLYSGSRSLRPALHLCRIENICERGTPDVEGFYRGTQFWVELKAIARRETLDTGVDPDQVAWHRRRAQAGGPSYFLIQVGSASGARRYLIRGAWGATIAAPITEEQLERMAVIPPRSSPLDIITALSSIRR